MLSARQETHQRSATLAELFSPATNAACFVCRRLAIGYAPEESTVRARGMGRSRMIQAHVRKFPLDHQLLLLAGELVTVAQQLASVGPFKQKQTAPAESL